jgi:GT2 family glycosyltransferase
MTPITAEQSDISSNNRNDSTLSDARDRMDATAAGITVSVLIPTKNRAEDLALATRSLLRQTSLPEELVILDQSADDFGQHLVEQEFAGVPSRVRNSVRLRYISDPSVPGTAAARNALLDAATGECVLFIDDDSYLEPDFIEEMLKCYAKHPEIVGISGIITNYPRPKWTARLWPSVFARGPFHDERQPIYWNADKLRGTEPLRVRKFTGASMSFRSEVIEGLRFNEALVGASREEDVDLCAELEDRVLVIEPAARLVHNKSPINRARSHWLTEHAQSAYYLYRRHWHRTTWNRLCFLWLRFGYFLVVPVACARRLTLEPWRAFCSGRQRALELTSGLPGTVQGSLVATQK